MHMSTKTEKIQGERRLSQCWRGGGETAWWMTWLVLAGCTVKPIATTLANLCAHCRDWTRETIAPVLRPGRDPHLSNHCQPCLEAVEAIRGRERWIRDRFIFIRLRSTNIYQAVWTLDSHDHNSGDCLVKGERRRRCRRDWRSLLRFQVSLLL